MTPLHSLKKTRTQLRPATSHDLRLTALVIACAGLAACAPAPEDLDEEASTDVVYQAWDSANGGNPTHPVHSYMTEYAVDQLKARYPELNTYRTTIVDGANCELHELSLDGKPTCASYPVEEQEALRIEIDGTNGGCSFPERLWTRARQSYKAGDKKRAYWYLGILLHFVEDMGVPAHAYEKEHQGKATQPSLWDNFELQSTFTRWAPNYNPGSLTPSGSVGAPQKRPGLVSPADYVSFSKAWTKQDLSQLFPAAALSFGVSGYPLNFYPLYPLPMSKTQKDFLAERRGHTALAAAWALETALEELPRKSDWIGGGRYAASHGTGAGRYALAFAQRGPYHFESDHVVSRSSDDGATFKVVLPEKDNGYCVFRSMVAINGILIASTALDHCGTYYSSNDGNTWAKSNLPVPGPGEDSYVRLLANRTGPYAGTVYARFRICGSGGECAMTLYRTTDGKTWTSIVAGLPQSAARAWGDLAVSDEGLFATIGTDVYRSDDNGKTWAPFAAAFSAVHPITKFAVMGSTTKGDPLHPIKKKGSATDKTGTKYFAACDSSYVDDVEQPAALFMSYDGVTWTDISRGVIDVSDPTAMFVSGETLLLNNGGIWASGYPGNLWMTDDLGAHFTDVGPGPRPYYQQGGGEPNRPPAVTDIFMGHGYLYLSTRGSGSWRGGF